MKNIVILLLTCCFVLIVVGCRRELKDGYKYCGICNGDGYTDFFSTCRSCYGEGQVFDYEKQLIKLTKKSPIPPKPEEEQTCIYKGRYSTPTQTGESSSFDFEFYSTYITVCGVKYDFLTNTLLNDDVWLDVYYKDFTMNEGVFRSCYGVIASTHDVKVWLYDGEGEPGSGYWADCEKQN